MLFALRLAAAIGFCSGGVVFAIAYFAPAHSAKLREFGSGIVIMSLALLGCAFAVI